MAEFPVLTESLALLHDVAANVRDDQLAGATPCADWNVAQVLLHAAGDQLGWAAAVAGTSGFPTYDPFAPPPQLEGTVDELIRPAILASSQAWEGVGSADSVPTPLPPFRRMSAELAAATCGLDAAIHAWDVAVATGQPPPLSAALAEQLQIAADQSAEPLRGFAYAPALPDSGAGQPVESLLRFLGRDPGWTS